MLFSVIYFSRIDMPSLFGITYYGKGCIMSSDFFDRALASLHKGPSLNPHEDGGGNFYTNVPLCEAERTTPGMRKRQERNGELFNLVARYRNAMSSHEKDKAMEYGRKLRTRALEMIAEGAAYPQEIATIALSIRHC